MEQSSIENLDSLREGMTVAMQGDASGNDDVIETMERPLASEGSEDSAAPDSVQTSLAESMGEDGEIVFDGPGECSASEFAAGLKKALSTASDVLNDADKGGEKVPEGFTGRAYPDALDGTPQSYTSKTQAEENQEAKIERPRQSKLESGDITDILKKCQDGMETIKQYEKDRSEVNAEISAVREQLETVGISKKALAIAIQYSKMSTDERDGFDLAYGILRKALGEPVRQLDMFKDSIFN